MAYYVAGPLMIQGMSPREPSIALAICALWGIYGWIYFMRSSARKGRGIFISAKPKVK
jgi:hypothetical protein